MEKGNKITGGRIFTMGDIYETRIEEHNRRTLELWENIMRDNEQRAIINIALTKDGAVSVMTIPGTPPEIVLATLMEIVVTMQGMNPSGSNLISV